MSFQADFYPMAGLDDTTVWPSPMYGAGLTRDLYGNVQYTSDYAMSSGFVDVGQFDAGQFSAGQFSAGQFSAGQFDAGTWDAWPGLASASGCQVAQPQADQAASTSYLRDGELAARSTDAKQDLDGKLTAVEERLVRIEQSIGRLQNELEQDRAQLAGEKETLCTEIESHVAQLQEWACTVRGLVETVGGVGGGDGVGKTT